MRRESINGAVERAHAQSRHSRRRRLGVRVGQSAHRTAGERGRALEQPGLEDDLIYADGEYVQMPVKAKPKTKE